MTDDADPSTHRTAPAILTLLIAVGVMFLLGTLAYLDSNSRGDDLASDVNVLEDTLASRGAVIDQLVTDQLKLRDQLQDEGITPDVGPPTQTIREIIREQPIIGEAGKDGVDGVDGRDGTDGRDGVTPACWFEQSQCQGADGLDGADGVDGQDGADSTVPGPAGATGATGATGADSTVPGPTGPAGPPGPPTQCEPGHHWTTVQIQGDDYRVCAAD